MSAYVMCRKDCGRIVLEVYGHESGVDRPCVAWLTNGDFPGELCVASAQEARALSEALAEIAALLPEVAE